MRGPQNRAAVQEHRGILRVLLRCGCDERRDTCVQEDDHPCQGPACAIRKFGASSNEKADVVVARSRDIPGLGESTG